ncbi:DUF1127 domain-containing protein [Agrobacterium sp. Ap1]|jgi:uncharacterized protein YjiS (DUF1127 family)|uniref:DUF1127 domain-containing protein n=1 Tax=Agrobacterium sp. Ap1 TaxID=2815337 RepID=UPI001A8EFE7B|nr:DUF1127 domain-containing protein [Agrobacterium sp. Ap1]MBO0140363.1 DUF1127 domain-containing protein [Agrobacterium sp. Ap1]
MSTTECGTDLKLVKATAPVRAGLVQTAVFVRIKSAWRAIRNRIAAHPLSELDDHMLDDIGLSRRDVVIALDRSGALDDPSLLLAKAARTRARTRFARPPAR